MFISRSLSSNVASSPQMDHGPPSPQMDHGPSSPHADLGPFDERNQTPHHDEDPCSAENLDESDTLYSEHRVQMLQSNGSMVYVEQRDHGPLSTHSGDDMYDQVIRDNEQVNSFDSDVNTLNTETQFHSHCDRWLKLGQRTNPSGLVTPPDSLCHTDLSQRSSGRTDSQGVSESSITGEMTQTSDSEEPNLENISYSEQSRDLENSSGSDLHQQSMLSVEYAAETDSAQYGEQQSVATRWPCDAASGGNVQLANGHIDGDSGQKDGAEVQPVIQVVVRFSLVGG